jgi:hypothetical protein
MATVIDSLLVTLGLDSKPYKKGADDAARSQKELRDNTKKTSIDITDSLKAVTRQVAAMVIGFESIKGAISFLSNVNDADAALGRLAANTGTSVHELNRWGNAAELAGGDAKGAQADVLALSQAITEQRTTGKTSPMLELIRRLGVSIFDLDTGKVRDLFTILKETGAALNTGRDRQTAFNLGTTGGLTGSLQLLLANKEAQKGYFDEAEKNNSLDERRAEQAAAMQRQWRELGQSARDFARTINDAVFPAVMQFFHALEPIKPVLVDIINNLKGAGAFEALATAIKGIASAIDYLVQHLPQAQQKLADFFEEADKFGIVKFNDPAALKRQDAEINALLHPITAIKGLFGYGNDAAVPAAQVQRARAGSAPAAAPAQGASTQVQIDTITVNTQATDADGIARDMRGAIDRKGIVGQSNTGMN